RVRRDEWLAARKRGAGFLRGSEHWSVAVMSDADGDGRLSFDEAWDYLRWRRDWLERRFGPLDEPAAADRANAALQADELTVRPVSVDARLVNWPLKARWQRLLEARARKAASASDRRVVQEEHYPLLPPQELHPALDGDQLVVLRGTEASARELFARAAGGDDLMDQRDWDRALASGDGLLRGSEHWSEASANARAGRLRFADVWAYLQWRRDFLERKFGPLDDAGAAARANAYLQADEQALAAAARSLPVKPAQPLGIVNALLLAGLLMGLYRLRTREGQVFAVLLVTYPITRFFLEMVRSSGHDLSRGVLTHNQYTSMIMVVLGAALLVALHRMTPSAGPAGQQRSGASSQPDSSKPRKGKK
ncbi:MAG: prolipoprotein diacylglyceryl transferase family protein, partial [Planctomycetota bacterium]